MKKKGLLLILLLWFALAYSQSKGSGVRATYIYEWPNFSYQKEYTLLVSNGISKYMRRQNKEKIETTQGYKIYFQKDYYDWYYDSKNKKIIQQKYLDDDKIGIAKWNANDFKWILKNQFEEINGYKVQKAISKAYIGGVADHPYGDVIAWFAPEIPLDSGPERYYGLPGLILKIEFTGRSATCTLKELFFDKIEKIDIPNKGKVITKKEAL
ncbi:MAG TPA: hypothetical protein DEO36_08410, partial [Flavobacteriaceae bacterium]|nr:hypothetical protein [Flavobacteriaceae bacterium]